MRIVIQVLYALTVASETFCRTVKLMDPKIVSPCNNSARANKDNFTATVLGQGLVPRNAPDNWAGLMAITVFRPGQPFFRVTCTGIYFTSGCNINDCMKCVNRNNEIVFNVELILENIDSKGLLRMEWLENDMPFVYSDRNYTLPEIVDGNNYNMTLTVHGPSQPIAGNECQFPKYVHTANIFQLCCLSTVTPCFAQIKVGETVVATDRAPCVTYVPTSNSTVNMVLKYSLCTKTDYIIGHRCSVQSGVLTTVRTTARTATTRILTTRATTARTATTRRLTTVRTTARTPTTRTLTTVRTTARTATTRIFTTRATTGRTATTSLLTTRATTGRTATTSILTTRDTTDRAATTSLETSTIDGGLETSTISGGLETSTIDDGLETTTIDDGLETSTGDDYQTTTDEDTVTDESGETTNDDDTLKTSTSLPTASSSSVPVLFWIAISMATVLVLVVITVCWMTRRKMTENLEQKPDVDGSQADTKVTALTTEVVNQAPEETQHIDTKEETLREEIISLESESAVD